MHQSLPPGFEMEDDGEEEDEDDYPVRQLIRPCNDGLIASILASLRLSD